MSEQFRWQVSVVLRDDPNGHRPVLAGFAGQADAEHWAEMINENPEYESVEVDEVPGNKARGGHTPVDDLIEAVGNVIDSRDCECSDGYTCSLCEANEAAEKANLFSEQVNELVVASAVAVMWAESAGIADNDPEEYLQLKKALSPFAEPVFDIGQSVRCRPDQGDDWHLFTGEVVGFRDELVQVRDQEDNTFDCHPHQLSPAE